LGLFVVFVYNIIRIKTVFQNTQKKIRCIDTSMFFSEKHRNIDVGKHRWFTSSNL